ncbi:MAG: hypothetical protein ABIC57_02545, partial [bacterium]
MDDISETPQIKFEFDTERLALVGDFNVKETAEDYDREQLVEYVSANPNMAAVAVHSECGTGNIDEIEAVFVSLQDFFLDYSYIRQFVNSYKSIVVRLEADRFPIENIHILVRRDFTILNKVLLLAGKIS